MLKVKVLEGMPIVFALVIAGISLKYLPLPYLWLSISGAILAIYMAGVGRAPAAKLTWLIICGLLLGLLLGEVFLWASEPGKRSKTTIIPKDVLRNDILGYAPKPEVRANVRKYRDGELLSDMHYTYSAQGFRIGPRIHYTDNPTCVLLFGGSYTFGSGVDDADTLAYQVELQSQGRYRVHNLAFRGYGPHHMLALLENSYEKKLAGCTPKVAVYQAIPDHVRRAAGGANWDRHGPRYVLSANGKRVTREGNFDDRDFENRTIEYFSAMASGFIKAQLGKSLIYARVFPKEHKDASQTDRERFVVIVNTARNIMKKRYPGSQFHIILSRCGWNRKRDLVGMTDAMHEKNMRVHTIEEIIADYCKSSKRYQIDPPFNGHPTPLYYSLMAKYLLTHIL